MKRYWIGHDHWGDTFAPEIDEDDNGEWCKADEAIAIQEGLAADLAAAQMRIAELEAALAQVQADYAETCQMIADGEF